MGVNQVAAYPLFKFPYTKMGSDGRDSVFKISTILKRRNILGILENKFYGAGFDRTSVWAFTRQGIPKYCSVTVPLYIGLGASGGTYWLHAFEDFFSIDYISTLWGTSKQEPWPEKVVL